jgi:hypothetical protein
MSEGKRFLLRRLTGDLSAETEQDLRDWLLKGLGKAGDFLYDANSKSWGRLGDHPALSSCFAKPTTNPEKRVVYILPPGSGALLPLGPFSIKETQQRLLARDATASSWVFVEGDKEWRQLKSLKALSDMLPPLPAEPPVATASSAAPSARPEPNTGSIPMQTSPSIHIDMSGVDQEPEREDPTMSISTLGLSLDGIKSLPPMPSRAPPPPAPPAAKAASAPVPPEDKDSGAFDGITAEIPTDPIWLVKPANAENTSGPFRFLEVVKYLEEGRLTKNDKISRVGANRFVKIAQQYEFNVKYSVETVVEGGLEKQKIFIRRRHPRVPYITGIQVMSKHGLLPGTCVNISAGGILMEMPKAEFNLGEILELKIMPGLIQKAISCKSLVIGRIPKIPPGYALKFEDLKPEDKEIIEHYVTESLKRQMAKNS